MKEKFILFFNNEVFFFFPMFMFCFCDVLNYKLLLLPKKRENDFFNEYNKQLFFTTCCQADSKSLKKKTTNV